MAELVSFLQCPGVSECLLISVVFTGELSPWRLELDVGRVEDNCNFTDTLLGQISVNINTINYSKYKLNLPCNLAIALCATSLAGVTLLSKYLKSDLVSMNDLSTSISNSKVPSCLTALLASSTALDISCFSDTICICNKNLYYEDVIEYLYLLNF